jgi:hypothetical protein
MVRASWGRLLRPSSWSEVSGWEGGACAAGCVPFRVWDWDAGCDCVLACVEEAVGGLLFWPPEAVVGGVDMPFGSSAGAGEAMLDGVVEMGARVLRRRC